MTRIEQTSPHVEQNQHAPINKSEILAGADTDGFNESGGTDERGLFEVPQQPQNKAHCFCPLLANEHGEETAVILQGLGYKVAKSKNVKERRRWFYDSLEQLEKRWPYLCDSGIHGIIQRQADKENVLKDGFNKKSYDRTTWYSVSDAITKRALEKDGKLWFDVPVAVACHSIIAGTLYQNVRFHLLKFLADNPDFTGTPYYKVNKAGLARVLPWSLSSVKRGFDDLLNRGLVGENPACSVEYTICNQADLIVPEGMKNKNVGSKKNHAFKSVSSTETNGSSTEMGSVSSTEVTGSSTEQIVSSTDETGSSPENNTHCKLFEKHIHKDHSLTAALAVGGACVNAADAAEASAHQDISKEHGSGTVPIYEADLSSRCSASSTELPQTLEDIRLRITTLQKRISQDDQQRVADSIPVVVEYYLSETLTYSILAACLGASWASDIKQIIAHVVPDLHKCLMEEAASEAFDSDTTDLFFLRNLEIVVGVLANNRRNTKEVQEQFNHCWDALLSMEDFVPDPLDMKEAPKRHKASLFLAEIQRCNNEGWPTYRLENVKFSVSTSKQIKEAALAFFEEHPEISARDAWRALADCVEVKVLKEKPDKFDPFFFSRQGAFPLQLFKHWDRILPELSKAGMLIA